MSDTDNAATADALASAEQRNGRPLGAGESAKLLPQCVNCRNSEARARGLEGEQTRLMTALADREVKLAAANEKTSVSLTVGGGLLVHGTMEAIHRCQQYFLLDSGHPQEREDVRRSLMRSLEAAEAKLRAVRALVLTWKQMVNGEGFLATRADEILSLLLGSPS